MTDTDPGATGGALLPCPHCGYSCAFERLTTGSQAWYVECGNCECRTAAFMYSWRARSMWNRRAAAPPAETGRAAADKRRIKLKALIVQMNDANDGISGMALLAHDYKNHAKYTDKEKFLRWGESR